MQPNNAADPDYQFIFNNAPEAKKSRMPNLPRGIFLGVGGVIILMIIIVLYGVISGSKSGQGATALLDVVGKSQEISRISTTQESLLKDPNIAALAATAATAATSDNYQVSNYLTSHKIKIDKKKLLTYQTNDKTIDDQLSQAAANNNLDVSYTNYLRTALNNYSVSLKSAYGATSSPTAKSILKNSFSSAQTLLNSSLLKS